MKRVVQKKRFLKSFFPFAHVPVELGRMEIHDQRGGLSLLSLRILITN